MAMEKESAEPTIAQEKLKRKKKKKRQVLWKNVSKMWAHKIGKKDDGTELCTAENGESIPFAAASQPASVSTEVVPGEPLCSWQL